MTEPTTDSEPTAPSIAEPSSTGVTPTAAGTTSPPRDTTTRSGARGATVAGRRGHPRDARRLGAATLIPLSMLIQWWLFGARPRWISSVRGGVRWRLLLRVTAFVLPAWVV